MMMLPIHPSVRGFIWRSITEGPKRGMSVGSANAGACATLIIHCQQIFTNGKKFEIPTGLSGEVGRLFQIPWLSPEASVSAARLPPQQQGDRDGVL